MKEYSGSTLVHPALDRLRDAARAGAFGTVVILSPDRLARKYVYQELVTDELTKAGVTIVYCNYQQDSSPEGQLLGGMQGLIAEYERYADIGIALETPRRLPSRRASVGPWASPRR